MSDASSYRLIYKDAEGGVITDDTNLEPQQVLDQLEGIMEDSFEEGETVEIAGFAG